MTNRDNVFNERIEALKHLTPPWGDRPSIYAYVARHLHPEVPGLLPGAETLPDEDPKQVEPGDPQIRFSPGLFEGIGAGGSVAGEGIEDITGPLKAAAAGPTDASLARAYEALSKHDTIDYIDPLLEDLARDVDLDREGLRALAAWLAMSAPDRTPVKAAMALLGGFGADDHLEVLQVLGRHDEFTLYAAVALRNSLLAPHRALMELGKNVDGWGRIQIIRRLDDATDPEVTGWMLRHGYKNNIMTAYTAYTCAVTGRLAEALAPDHVDDELFDGAGGIISGLLDFGPPEQYIDEYEAGLPAVQQYLRHAESHVSNVQTLLTLSDIIKFVNASWLDEAALSKKGWTREAKVEVEARCNYLLALPAWRGVVTHALEHDETLWLAAFTARLIGVDPWPYVWTRAKRGDVMWTLLFDTASRERFEQALALAEAHFDADRVGVTPGVKLQFKDTSEISPVLAAIANFPGLGWPLVSRALRSSYPRTRRSAVEALSSWPREAWPDEAMAELSTAADRETDGHVLENMRSALAGERLQPGFRFR